MPISIKTRFDHTLVSILQPETPPPLPPNVRIIRLMNERGTRGTDIYPRGPRFPIEVRAQRQAARQQKYREKYREAKRKLLGI